MIICKLFYKPAKRNEGVSFEKQRLQLLLQDGKCYETSGNEYLQISFRSNDPRRHFVPEFVPSLARNERILRALLCHAPCIDIVLKDATAALFPFRGSIRTARTPALYKDRKSVV